MNSSIMIKGADFSDSNVGKLKLQKLEVVKDGNTMIGVSNGNLSILHTTWGSDNEIAHSQEIVLPEGTKHIFGKISTVLATANIDPYLRNETNFIGVPNSFFCYYRSSTSTWTSTSSIWSLPYNKVKILARKDGLFQNNDYTCAVVQGGLYGYTFTYDDITKIVINWVRDSSMTAPEIGMVVPELYAGF